MWIRPKPLPPCGLSDDRSAWGDHAVASTNRTLLKRLAVDLAELCSDPDPSLNHGHLQCKLSMSEISNCALHEKYKNNSMNKAGRLNQLNKGESIFILLLMLLIAFA